MNWIDQTMLYSTLRWRGAKRVSAAEWGLAMLLGGLVVGLGACANPVPPSGGPKDTTPPAIVGTRPVKDTVNVDTTTQSVYIEFSEYVERSTVNQSLTVTPRFDGRLQYDWSGRGVSIKLPSTLLDSTTYIFSFDTNLSDARGVSLNSPIRIAFATGPRINQGELKGRVVAPRRGEPVPDVTIFAYEETAEGEPPSRVLPDRPDYRTQTGRDGTFAFDYLREQSYYVIALQDNNRNRRPDPSEAVAAPPRKALAADSGSTPVPVPWLLAQVDTTGPQLQQVRPLSRSRLRVNFDEPVRLPSRTPADWALRDSVADAPVAVRDVYQPGNRPEAVVLRTDSMAPTRHALVLSPGLVADTLGHPLLPDTARFQAAARPDTTQTRFRAFVPTPSISSTAGTTTVLPDVSPGVRFNQPPDSSVLAQGLSVQDTSGAARDYTVSTSNGHTYRLRLDPSLTAGTPVDVAVDGRLLAGPDSTYRQRFVRISDDRLGAFEGQAVIADTSHPAVRGAEAGPSLPSLSDPMTTDTTAADTAGADTTAAASARTQSPIVVEARAADRAQVVAPRTMSVRPESTFVFAKLPEGDYRFRAFQDRNDNGRWDPGTVQPFQAAERITWSASASELRPRWTSVLPSALRIPRLVAPSMIEAAPTPDSTAADSADSDTP